MSNHILVAPYSSPVGILLIGTFDDHLVLCDWKYRKQRDQIDHRLTQYFNASLEYKKTRFHQTIFQQLEDYFNKGLKKFTIPILLAGTNFQKDIWNTLLDLEYGEVISYGALSRKRNQQKAIRALAAANGANALSIIVPCHRVVGADGSLTGYAGGLKAKRYLIDLERKNSDTGQMKLFI
ncbi:methylated-DNA--[protein]-cysteine S-methyltransferase [Nonlabens tegetincola]|uniref:methylated-DNA--[protein]-cysteine S-methyltransferase n=1 Tax=Nonlabens tegetincola TaxID=323273 RepID=UPI000CF3CEB3|nr:methylated-DNA--[protein]-cysteine S-methyltransferase [Nonlabens tegetincola]PQJ16932.1 cysteine methyltransferase [Nonlabens tegetincola]